MHPLHLEDARSTDERVKVDQTAHYTFAVLKPARILSANDGGDAKVVFSTIDIFAGEHDSEPFFITIADPNCAASQDALARARREGSDDKPSQLLYLILDTTVDLYFPAIDHYDDSIDALEERG